MGKEVVPLRQLPGFLSELRERGARRITRTPAGFDGSVVVRWEDADEALRERAYRSDLYAFVPAAVLSGAFLVLVGIVFAVITFLTGGLAGP